MIDTNSPAVASGTNDSYTLPRRILKFRNWMPGYNRFAKKTEILDNLMNIFNGRLVYETDDDLKNVEDFEESGHQLTQFTGLYDKNGVEIYEGDIVQYGFDLDAEKEIGVVKYGVHNYPAFEIYPVTIEDSNMLQFYHEEGEIEVLGNIFENPELLERV